MAARLVLTLTLAALAGLACTDRPEPSTGAEPPATQASSAAEPTARPASSTEPKAAKPADPPAAEPRAADEPPPAPPGFMPAPPAFDGLPLTARLPADASGLVALASPADLARRIGLDGLMAALGPEAEQLRAELKGRLGHDLFDVAGWRAAGLDPDGPAGVAVLRLEPALVAFAVTVKDAAALRSTVIARAAALGVELAPSQAGELHFLYGARLTFAIGPREAWLVLGDRLEPGETLHHARALAQRPPSTLVARQGVAPVLVRLNYGRDVAAIVNLPAIIDAALRARLGPARQTRIERQLRGAEALGETAEAEALRARLDKARAEDFKRGAGTLAAGMVVRSYLSAFGGLALGVNIDEAAVQLRFAHHLDRASPVGRIFASRTGPLALRAAFARAPAGLAELNVDPVALYDLVRAVATALGGGRELGEANAVLRAATGHDLAAVAGLLAGDVGAAAEIDPARLDGVQRPDELLSRVRFAGHLGLQDPAGAIALLDRITAIAERGLVAIEGPADGPRRWRLGLNPALTLWIAVADHQLFLSLDEATSTRLAAQAGGQSAGFVADLQPPVQAMLDGRDGGWSGWLDIGALGPLMMDAHPAVLREAPDGDGPASKLMARIAALDRQIADHRRAHRETAITRGRAMLGRLGRAATSVRPVSGGLDGRLGLYVGAKSVPDAVAAVAGEVREADARFEKLWTETLDPLYEKRRALQAELQALEQEGARP